MCNFDVKVPCDPLAGHISTFLRNRFIDGFKTTFMLYFLYVLKCYTHYFYIHIENEKNYIFKADKFHQQCIIWSDYIETKDIWWFYFLFKKSSVQEGVIIKKK